MTVSDGSQNCCVLPAMLLIHKSDLDFSFCQQASRSPVPSLERLKPFEGGGDDDDDGLDKDLWVVVEKGSVCASRDCVYRDAVSAECNLSEYSTCTCAPIMHGEQGIRLCCNVTFVR